MIPLEDIETGKLFENLPKITVSPRTLQYITDVNKEDLGISSKKKNVDSGYFSCIEDEVQIDYNYEDREHFTVVEIQHNLQNHSVVTTRHDDHKSDHRLLCKPEINHLALSAEIRCEYKYDDDHSTNSKTNKTDLKSLLKKTTQFVMKVFSPKESNYSRRLKAIKQRRESKNLSISFSNKSSHAYVFFK